MLNVWHLVAYQRYYDGLIAATGGSQGAQQQRPAPQLSAMGSNIVDVSSCQGARGLLPFRDAADLLQTAGTAALFSRHVLKQAAPSLAP